MSARIGQGSSRFEEAKEAAKKIVERSGRRSDVSQIMILSFGRTAQVVTGFESNRSLLLEAIDSIMPTDEEADLDGALQLASAFAAHRPDHDPLIRTNRSGCHGI